MQCIAKGKQHKPYEFGSKASMIIGRNSGIVLGAHNIEINDYDGHTLEKALEQFVYINGYDPQKAIGELGYRGRRMVNNTIIQTPSTPPKATAAQKTNLRKDSRRRSLLKQPSAI